MINRNKNNEKSSALNADIYSVLRALLFYRDDLILRAIHKHLSDYGAR
jgi:hypothetical protein